MVVAQFKSPNVLFFFQQALHRGLSLFLSYTVREFPRLTISGMYMFYYEDIFLPFIQVTCPKHRLAEENIHSLLYVSDYYFPCYLSSFLPHGNN